jgi:hypothetical protein
MEITMRWHRLLRALAFAAGLALGLGAAVFIFSNLAPIDVHWRIPSAGGYVINWNLKGVSLWLLALVPLLVGAIAGYFYQTPARMHHVREALHHRHRVHELEHELKELRGSLDEVLMMPEDGTLAVPALVAKIERVTAVEEPEVEEPEPEVDPRLPDEPAAAELLAAAPLKPNRPARARKSASKLPAAIPATVVARPRRNGKAAANGSTRRPRAAAKPKSRTEKPG